MYLKQVVLEKLFSVFPDCNYILQIMAICRKKFIDHKLHELLVEFLCERDCVYVKTWFLFIHIIYVN